MHYPYIPSLLLTLGIFKVNHSYNLLLLHTTLHLTSLSRNPHICHPIDYTDTEEE